MTTTGERVMQLSCPTPVLRYDTVLMAHGGGGRLSQELLDRIFFPAFQNETLQRAEDQATLPAPQPGQKLAMTTDAFVVNPLFFPGGDVGQLAIHGTLNDLAVGGARPRYIAAAFVMEEGLKVNDLQRIVASMAAACREDNVQVVCGDTKVVEQGKGDGVFITTTGIGVVEASSTLSISTATPGDQILVSGTLGDHGVSIMSLREGLQFETALKSDTASLVSLVHTLLEALPAGSVRCMRDPTRGGLASTLNEIASASKVGIQINERAVPVRPEVHGACEMLGLDPLYVANEGKLVAVVTPGVAPQALEILQAHPLGRSAARIGEVVKSPPGVVSARSAIGGERTVPMISGEQLPRIC